MSEKKRCRVCRKLLSGSAFNGSAKSPDGLNSACRACVNARRRERHRVSANRDSGRSLAAALRAGNLDAVRGWIRRGSQPDWSWVCETMRGGHFEVAEFVMQSGVSRNIFTMAAMAETAHLKRRLRRFAQDARRTANMEPGCVAVTPLHVACAAYLGRVCPNGTKSQLNVAEQLLAHGADVNARARYRDLEDATPLTCACWSSGNVVLVDTLLNHGAIASERDLFAALGHYQRHASPAFDIAESLLAAGIAVDGRVSGEFTLLQTFAHQAAHRTVAWLIKRGADVNRRGPGGRTAAHFAAERNTGPRTLELLIAHGADLTCRDDDGNRPIDVARRNGKLGLVELHKRSR